MRKINSQTILDPITSAPVIFLSVKEDDGTHKTFREAVDESVPCSQFKLTEQQKAIITQTNTILEKNGQDLVQDDEIYYLITGGLDGAIDPTDEELQKLSGFKVTKTIEEFTTRTPEADQAVIEFLEKQEEFRKRNTPDVI